MSEKYRPWSGDISVAPEGAEAEVLKDALAKEGETRQPGQKEEPRGTEEDEERKREREQAEAKKVREIKRRIEEIGDTSGGEHDPHPANETIDDEMPAESEEAERLDALELEKLHRLLLTPEEEETARESGEEIREIKKRSENGAEFVGRGFAHSNSVEPMRPTVEALMQEDPDIVLIEGGLSLEEFYPGESLDDILKKDPAQVIAEKGEEPYIALLAMREGKEVRTWDTRTIEQIREVLKLKDETTGETKYKPQDVADWIVAYAARRAHVSDVPPSADEIRRRSGVALSGGGVEEAASLGIELTDENIDAALQRHMGLSLAEFLNRFDDPESRNEDRARIIEITEPQLVGERRVTSDVLRDMNIIRDQHAIEVFRKLKKRYPDKKLFAIGGASHLTVWKPALDALYKASGEATESREITEIKRSIEEIGDTSGGEHGPHSANEKPATPAPETEGRVSVSTEVAREILGRDRVFGVDELRERLGLAIDDKDLPEIPFSAEELEQAKKRGEKLLLRTDSFEDGSPLTLENLMKRFPGIVSGEITGNSEEDSWAANAAMLKKETPRREWVLVRTGELVPGTEHLSFEAQEAFMKKDYEGLGAAIERMQAFWDSDDIVQNGPPREMIESARSKIPSLQELKALRESLPESGKLPRAVEVLYDYLLTGKRSPSQDLEIATGSVVEAGIGEPVDRPVDIGFVDGGIKVHTRRDARFGRPNALGDKKPGVAIGYIQH